MTSPSSRLLGALTPGLATLVLVALTHAAAAQPTAEQQSAIRASCRSDFMSKCSGVTPGGKDALVCLQKNVASLSPACKTAVSATIPAPAPVQAAPAPASAPVAPAAAVAPPPQPAPAPAAPTQAPAAKPAIAAAPPPAKPKPPQPTKPAAPVTAAVAPPTQVAPPPTAESPRAEPVIPLAKIEAMPLPERLAIMRSCRVDREAVCPAARVGEGRIIACLAAHTNALSAGCRNRLAKALQ